jgi:hypothetical protein
MDIVTTSIGSDFAAYLVRKIKEKTFGLFFPQRIIALEPRKIVDDPLNTTDSTFIMSIYTSDYKRDDQEFGHVQFYVNGGKKQPKCNKILDFFKLCDLERAQEYWEEAVRNFSSSIFPARKCDSYEKFQSGECNLNPMGFMNTKTDPSLRGKYYLDTNEESPYSKALPAP